MITAGKIGIVGLGLIGGSVARSLANRRTIAGCTGFDSDPKILRAALDAGVIQEIAESLNALADCDLIVVAVPVRATPLTVVELSKVAGGVIVELSSVKAPMIAALHQCTDPSRIVLTHPMAGKEFSGFPQSSSNLFESKSWILCDHPAVSTRACELTVELMHACGAVPVSMNASRHDEIVARTSHLPQVISTALAALLEGEARTNDKLLAACGTGVRSMTRLAGSPYDLWTDILTLNRNEVFKAVREFNAALLQFLDAMEHGHGAEWFARAESFYRQSRSLDE